MKVVGSLLRQSDGFDAFAQGLALGVSGKPAGSQRLPIIAAYNFTISQSNTLAKALVAATASTVFTIKKGTVASPTTIGTITFAAGATVATISITAGSVSAGDMVWVECPSTADATLADIAVLLRP